MERLTRVFEKGNQKYACIDVCGEKCVEGYSICHKCKPFTSVMKKLAEYEDAEEQGLFLRLPCRLGDIIDRIISHNENVTLMFETEVCSFRGLQHFWHGMAWNIPKEYLELPFVKIHGVVPDKITEADTIWIEVRKEAEQALARLEK